MGTEMARGEGACVCVQVAGTPPLSWALPGLSSRAAGHGGPHRPLDSGEAWLPHPKCQWWRGARGALYPTCACTHTPRPQCSSCHHTLSAPHWPLSTPLAMSPGKKADKPAGRSGHHRSQTLRTGFSALRPFPPEDDVSRQQLCGSVTKPDRGEGGRGRARLRVNRHSSPATTMGHRGQRESLEPTSCVTVLGHPSQHRQGSYCRLKEELLGAPSHARAPRQLPRPRTGAEATPGHLPERGSRRTGRRVPPAPTRLRLARGGHVKAVIALTC